MAIDVVGLERIKNELRLPADDDSQDALLTGHIISSVSFIETLIDKPILDTTHEVFSPPAYQGNTKPICFYVDSVKSANEIKYWTLQGELRSDPDGTIDADSLGRFQRSRSPKYPNALYPPAAGWPASLAQSCFIIMVTRGMLTTENAPAIAQAVVICVRQFYDGFSEIRPNAALFSLVAPFQFIGERN